MPAFADLLGDLAGALDALGLRWYLFGAQAVAVHGRPRLTEDVDVTVDLGGLDPKAVVAALADRGFTLSEMADDAFVAATRVLPFTHEPSGMALDLVIAGPGLEDLFLSEAETHSIGGTNIPVIRAEHLVVTKILAGRPKDIADAAEVVAGRPDLDLSVVRGLLGDLEAALGQSDLLPLFESICES